MPRWITRWLPVSSPMTRFLPSLPTDLIVWPSSRVRNSFTDLCRFVSLPFVTVTVFSFLPASSRLSAARTVSTSGSSGTSRLPCGAGRGQLGALLGRPLAGSGDRARDRHGRLEPLLVAGARAAHLVDGGAHRPGLRPLLQPALHVRGPRGLGLEVEARLERGVHHATGGLEPPVEVDRRDDRLVGVGEHRVLVPPARGVLATPEPQRGRHAELAGGGGEGPLCDGRLADLGEPALGEVELSVGALADHEPDDRVAEELEALV